MDGADALAKSIVHRYLVLWRYQRRFSQHLRKTLNISGRQLAVLRYLIGAAPCTVSQISRFLYVRDATTSPLLERMEQAGYVRRHRSNEDSRKVLVEPTKKGCEIIKRAPLGAIASMRTHLPELSVAELKAIDAALEKLSEVAQVDESLLHGER